MNESNSSRDQKRDMPKIFDLSLWGNHFFFHFVEKKRKLEFLIMGDARAFCGLLKDLFCGQSEKKLVKGLTKFREGSSIRDKAG